MWLSRYLHSQTATHMHGHHEGRLKSRMGLAGMVTGRELRALALSHTPLWSGFGAAWHRLRTRSQTRVQTAPSHSKWSAASRPSQPLREERVGNAVPGLVGLHTVT